MSCSINSKQEHKTKTVLMLVDESMSGWRSKIKKFGGIPNYTYEFSQYHLECPKLVHLTYASLQLVDEHNKQRRKILGTERKWPMWNCWFRLLTTLMGIRIVDMLYWTIKK